MSPIDKGFSSRLHINANPDQPEHYLPGTGWELTVHSSAVSPFTVSGKNGFFAIGNDKKTWGDRYTATLHNAELPLGFELNFIQIDLSDHDGQLIDRTALDVYPDLTHATAAGGRFFITNSAPEHCTQCSYTLTSFGFQSGAAIDDSFDDGDVGANSLGPGTGFTTFKQTDGMELCRFGCPTTPSPPAMRCS